MTHPDPDLLDQASAILRADGNSVSAAAERIDQARLRRQEQARGNRMLTLADHVSLAADAARIATAATDSKS